MNNLDRPSAEVVRASADAIVKKLEGAEARANAITGSKKRSDEQLALVVGILEAALIAKQLRNQFTDQPETLLEMLLAALDACRVPIKPEPDDNQQG